MGRDLAISTRSRSTGKEISSRIGMNTSGSGSRGPYTRYGVEMTPGLVYKLKRMTL